MSNSRAIPSYIAIEIVSERLPLIFPDGTPARSYLTRDLAAKTVFTMLYCGAVEGFGQLISPKHVYRMSDRQAAKTTNPDRIRYAQALLSPGFRSPGRAWYADTTREPIRDETLRGGLVMVGAATADPSVPATSSKPRYSLTRAFAKLFEPGLIGADLEREIENWRRRTLSKSALMRTALKRSGLTASKTGVSVRFPNGEGRQLSPGLSSVISKAVIEVYAPTFLKDPAVLWLSESANKVVKRDDDLAKSIGLNIDVQRTNCRSPTVGIVSLVHE